MDLLNILQLIGQIKMLDVTLYLLRIFNQQDEKFVSKVSKLIPMGRMANQDEYKNAIQFLCSQASSYMTGHNLVMDGGRTIW